MAVMWAKAAGYDALEAFEKILHEGEGVTAKMDLERLFGLAEHLAAIPNAGKPGGHTGVGFPQHSVYLGVPSGGDCRAFENSTNRQRRIGNEMETSAIVALCCSVVAVCVSIAMAIVTYANYQLAKKKRRDDLFDRRYAFYQKIRKIWLATNANASDDEYLRLEIEDVIPLAEESGFLFGQDIMNHVLSLVEKEHSGSPFFPNEDFVLPFKRYLDFE